MEFHNVLRDAKNTFRLGYFGFRLIKATWTDIAEYYCERLEFYEKLSQLDPETDDQKEIFAKINGIYLGIVPDAAKVLPRVRKHCNDDITSKLEALLKEAQKIDRS